MHARIGARDTTPELLLRSALHSLGLRYRLHAPDLPGRPDIVFRRLRVAVFCDGDFWHGRDWARRRARLSQGSNAAYWIAKIESNMKRDRRNVRSLRDMGWTVVRLWERDIAADSQGCARRVTQVLGPAPSRRS